LNGVSVARRKREKPPRVAASRSRASPAWGAQAGADLLGSRGRRGLCAGPSGRAPTARVSG